MLIYKSDSWSHMDGCYISLICLVVICRKQIQMCFEICRSRSIFLLFLQAGLSAFSASSKTLSWPFTLIIPPGNVEVPP